MHTNRAFSAFSAVDDIPKFGVRAEDVILSCKFGIHDFSVNDFQSYLHPMNLNCYTFKGVRLDDKGTTAKLQMVGPQNRVFHDKIKFYILRQNLHQTCFNDFSNVKWYMKQTLV